MTDTAGKDNLSAPLVEPHTSDVDVPRRDAVISELIENEVPGPFRVSMFAIILTILPFVPHMMEFPFDYPVVIRGVCTAAVAEVPVFAASLTDASQSVQTT